MSKLYSGYRPQQDYLAELAQELARQGFLSHNYDDTPPSGYEYDPERYKKIYHEAYIDCYDEALKSLAIEKAHADFLAGREDSSAPRSLNIRDAGMYQDYYKKAYESAPTELAEQAAIANAQRDVLRVVKSRIGGFDATPPGWCDTPTSQEYYKEKYEASFKSERKRVVVNDERPPRRLRTRTEQENHEKNTTTYLCVLAIIVAGVALIYDVIKHWR